MSNASLMDIEPRIMDSVRAGPLLSPTGPILDPIGSYWSLFVPHWPLVAPIWSCWTPYGSLLDPLLVPIGPYIVRGELLHIQGGQCENKFVPSSGRQPATNTAHTTAITTCSLNAPRDSDLQLERTTAIPTCSLSASMQSATKQRNNFIFEQTGAGNNRAREHFTEARN